MCLGIPGKITAIKNAEQKLALVDVGGITREVNIACILDESRSPEEAVGQWVLIHVGFALGRLNEVEAAETLKILSELGELKQEQQQMQQSAGNES